MLVKYYGLLGAICQVCDFSFARPHKTLTNPYPKTLAMAAGLTNHAWTVEEIVKLLG